MPSSLTPLRQLRQLARSYGVQTAYLDVRRQRHTASPEALLSMLALLGVPVCRLTDVPEALRQYQATHWQEVCEPVLVVRPGRVARWEVCLPGGPDAGGTLECGLRLETGEEHHQTYQLNALSVVDSAIVEGRRYTKRQLLLPGPLPLGYHQLHVEGQGKRAHSLLISSPLRAYTPAHKTWGVFVPLYALHSEQSWGAGDFGDLERVIDWTSQLGGGVVATLPLLAAFLAEPFEPSPYAPVSRLVWNEFYVDVEQIPELADCQEAQTLLTSAPLCRELCSLRAVPFVDYQRQMALKRRILEALAQHFFRTPSARVASFERFCTSHPNLEDYARFRAAGERWGPGWRDWPSPLCGGILAEHTIDPRVKNYHLYAQWIAHEQMAGLAHKARAQGPGLYLDLPLGVHPDGYDVWRERAAFIDGMSSGSPPDVVFTQGQDWGFPPLHPQANRQNGYRYVIAYLRHHLQHAGLLRIDHIMGLHRLFCIPHGFEASQGMYLRYPAEELYAILSLESQRHQAAIVGENLGTVPSAVNRMMRRCNIQPMHVLQYELPATLTQPLAGVPDNAVASINTHDFFPFHAFWQGGDLKERLALGLLDQTGVQQEQHNLEGIKKALVQFLRDTGWLNSMHADAQTVLRACLDYLAASPAQVVLITLEDLWGELLPQNVPSTGAEKPNWRRKTHDPFEVWSQGPEVQEILRRVQLLREQADTSGI